MFYVDGDYEARKGSGIGKGSISVHPGGHPHGPQPGATEGSIGVHYFDELAVMVDTFRPLELGGAGRAVDDGTYALSWLRAAAATSGTAPKSAAAPKSSRPMTEPPSHG
jgi:homogentisate 1,2-dioxygenase